MKLPSKSRFAFDCSVKELPVSRGGNLKMWTFTFAEVIPVAEGRRRWSDFLRKLRQARRYTKLCGLRVFELHPGGHGLHTHVLTGHFVEINFVRGLWASCGGGRVHVKQIAADRAGYCGKYLTKQGRPSCFKGVRMWAAFGGFEGTRVRDVTITSNWTRAYARLKLNLGAAWGHLRWHDKQRAVRNVVEGIAWWHALTGVAPLPGNRIPWMDDSGLNPF